MAKEVQTTQDLKNRINSEMYLKRSLTDWWKDLREMCQVYAFNENYIAKRFDQINYKFCSKDEAKEILVDNLYAVLRFNFFEEMTDEIDDRISNIVKSFTGNLKTTLKKVSFDMDTDCQKVNTLPSYCMAFRNGVYNFKDNKWLFKYNIVDVESLNNKIYLYDPNYIIFWYMDIEFEPLPFNITEIKLPDFIKAMKELDGSNYCFKLLYNMAHDRNNEFLIERFIHICEIMGYTMLQDFCQSFVMLIGTGGNGKNSLFDGCFTPYVRPMPTANNLDSIETDRFITGALENRYQNIYLESDPKTYEKSTVLKNITGSMYQTIEPKGINKYSGLINCKFIFSANDQDKIKFGDNTEGFRRRINMFEIFFHWDEQKRFLKKGDYYDTTFSEDLHEIKNDPQNVITFIYFAMYGIISATNSFTKTFKFTQNDWKEKYSDIDSELKDRIESINVTQIVNLMESQYSNEDKKLILFDESGKRLYQSKFFTELGYETFEDMINMLKDDESRINFFSNNDAYINLKVVHNLSGDLRSATSFTQLVKKIYRIRDIDFTYNNRPYVRCTFVGNKLRILN